MYQTLALQPGVTLRCIRDTRFKQAVLSVQFLRPMCREEAALNALIPAILLRGCEAAPDLQAITARLDDLYGGAVEAQVRRIGDYQTTGLSCRFIEDRFALPGDKVLEPMVEFLGQLLLHPLMEKNRFLADFVSSEKRNLISALEAQRNDKQAYASAKLLKIMCRGDSFAIPRLGEIADVRHITPLNAFVHYQKLLWESPVEIFYVGSASADRVAQLVGKLFSGLKRTPMSLPPQKPLTPNIPTRRQQEMDVTQGKLALGFTTPITFADPRFAAMQLCNTVFGAGMTSKLFRRVREEMSLCYAIGSGYYGSKGLMTVHAGIDSDRCRLTKKAILAQLRACQRGQITVQELEAAREAVLSGLRAVYDSPNAMESFFSTAAVSGLGRSPEQYAEEIQAVTLADVQAAAQTLALNTSFFLKGVSHEEN